MEKVKFNNGKLRILQISDAQDLHWVRKTMLQMLNNACDMLKPDLIVFTGDNILGNHLLDARFGSKQIASGRAATMKIMRESIHHICAPLDKRKIPFAMIYGNHDDMNLVSKEEQAVVKTFLLLKSGGDVDFQSMSETLFAWSAKWIGETD